MRRRRPASVYDDAYAAVYDAIFGSEKHAEDVVRLASVLERVGPDERILDVGCGTGTMCGLLRRTHPRVEGLDLSAGMLEVARRKNPGLHFTQGDLLDGDLYPAGIAILRSWLRSGGWLCLELLVDNGTVGGGPDVLSSVLVDTDHLLVEGGWDLRDGSHLVFAERIVTPGAVHRTAHRLTLLPRSTIDELLESAGFVIDGNVGDERNPLLCCRAV
jgi:SAM-dependent methyltransferase